MDEAIGKRAWADELAAIEDINWVRDTTDDFVVEAATRDNGDYHKVSTL